MVKAVLRWTFILAALFAVGPFASAILTGLRDVDGGHAFSLLVGASPIGGLFRGLIVLAIAGLMGVVGAVAFGRETGVVAAGLILAWSAWRLGTIEEILRAAPGAGTLARLGVEGGLLGVGAIALACILQALGTRGTGEGFLFASRDEAASPGLTIAAAVGAGAVVGGVVATLVAAEPLKGQAVFAAIMGGLAAGAAAQTAAKMFHSSVTLVAPMASVALLAILGPIVAAMLSGTHALADAHADRLLTLARPISFDWLAGGLLGIPIGIGWSTSMLDRPATGQPKAAT